ncbi:hypothetical protein M153_1800004148 [Pseudoloma neurophilia]|uniref:Uncharacterized protein n=1 Tax=Pseudoloma neurophilia TaxID=146866 RepID=A0A0R0LZC6_9MICR|nr:hypothetical protein M153_1800004148 [Pseudoloma neurophilia]
MEPSLPNSLYLNNRYLQLYFCNQFFSTQNKNRKTRQFFNPNNRNCLIS